MGLFFTRVLLAFTVLLVAGKSAALLKSTGCGLTGKPTGNFHLSTTDGRGTTRDFEVMVPTSYKPSVPLALSIVYHGAGGTQANSKALGLQDAPGAAAVSIFAFPQGVPYQNFGVGWDDSCSGYDVVLFDRMLAALGSTYCIDLERVFVAGFSWGCDHVTALSCCRGNKIRAVAAASCTDEFRVVSDYRTYNNWPCPVTSTAAVRFTHALGGDDSYPSPRFASTSQLYQAINRCSSTSAAVAPSPCVGYQGCRNPFIECAYSALGHSVPQGWASDSWNFFASSPRTTAPAVPALPHVPRFALPLVLLGVGLLSLRRFAR